MALGSVAGQVVEPVLYLPLSIYLVYVNYITIGGFTPQRDMMRLSRGSRPLAQADSQRQTTSGAQSVAERGQGFNVPGRKTCSFALASRRRRLRRFGAFVARQLLVQRIAS